MVQGLSKKRWGGKNQHIYKKKVSKMGVKIQTLVKKDP